MEVEAVPPAEGWCHSLTDKGEYGKFVLYHTPLVTKFLTAANVRSSQRCMSTVDLLVSYDRDRLKVCSGSGKSRGCE